MNDLVDLATIAPVDEAMSDSLTSSAILFAATITALLLLSCLCTSVPFAPLELLFAVQPPPPESVRSRIRRLILPAEALEHRHNGAPATPSGTAHLTTAVAKRLSEAATGLRHRRSTVAAQLHTWTFNPLCAAARDCTPLLVFVNRGSGGRQGEQVVSQLRALLSPPQVVDLGDGVAVAENALQSFRSVGRFRVLVCGGDGTVSWVLSLLDAAALESTPPVAVLPLGTGNDLARALGWGGGRGEWAGGARDLMSTLEEVERAQVALLDRWMVGIENARPPRRSTISAATIARSASTKNLAAASAAAPAAPAAQIAEKAPRSLVMQNYLGVGVDARIALDWHRRRQADPGLFTSRFLNKLRYAAAGARQLFRPNFVRLCANLQVVADGVPLELPQVMRAQRRPQSAREQRRPRVRVCEFLAGPDLRRPSRPPATQGTEGVIVLNIGSYGGGSDLWGSIAESDTSVEPVQPEGDATSTADGGEFSRDEDGELMAAMATEAAAVGGEAAADCESLGPSPSPRSEPSRERVRRESFDGMFASPSMADELLEVVAVQGVLHMGLALMSLGGARRLCQCRHLTISSQQGLPIQASALPGPTGEGPARGAACYARPRPQLARPVRLVPLPPASLRAPRCGQVDGEPFEFEPLFAPRRGLSISVRHLNQAVMLSRSKVRSDGVALEALDWAMQEGVITVEQRNCVLREVARRTGDLQRRKSGLGGLSSSRSFHAVNDFLASG